jgi:hypothetical protein
MYRLVPLMLAYTVAACYWFFIFLSNEIDSQNPAIDTEPWLNPDLVGIGIICFWLTVPRLIADGIRRHRRGESLLSLGVVGEVCFSLIYIAVFVYSEQSFQDEMFQSILMALFWYFVGYMGIEWGLSFRRRA